MQFKMTCGRHPIKQVLLPCVSRLSVGKRSATAGQARRGLGARWHGGSGGELKPEGTFLGRVKRFLQDGETSGARRAGKQPSWKWKPAAPHPQNTNIPECDRQSVLADQAHRAVEHSGPIELLLG